MVTLGLWAKVYWKQATDGTFDTWTGIGTGHLCHCFVNDSADITDFNGKKVPNSEVSSLGQDDGWALAARNPLGVL